MIIEIDDTKTIEEVAKSFCQNFPFLKIEFYDEAHHWQEQSSRKHMLPHYKTIGEVRKRHNPGAMEIHNWQKAGTVEQQFRKLFDLNVQLFRQEGDMWVQTAGTDELTIEEQNEIGRNASQDLLHGTDRKFEEEKHL
jgi:hypothetical protein